MEPKTILKWFFSPKDSGTMSKPRDDSPSAAQSDPDSSNVPTDPDRAAESSLTEEVQRLDLDGSIPVEEPEAEGGLTGEEENGKGEVGVGVVEVVEEGGEGDEDERSENSDRDETEKEGGDRKEETHGGVKKSVKYPVRPEAEDCAYYIKTGTCKFGSNCKFNHPVRRTIQAGKDKINGKDEAREKSGQIECKFYLSPGGCKFGKGCKFSHARVNHVAPAVELNFLGLPIRLGEKECPYYMRTGTCKYAANCKFNHPDPTNGGDNLPVEYSNGGSASLRSASQFPLWSSPGSLSEYPSFVPMVYSPTQISSPSAEWNGYQFPMNPAPGPSMPPPPPYVMHSPPTENHMYTNHQHQMVIDEYPERPGQPECSYYLKTGDCKFKSNCKYHHPKERNSKPTHVAFSDKGLPLRPDQNICTNYSRYGICKFGPACKFDHSVHVVPSTVSGEEYQSSSGNSLPGTDGVTKARPRSAGDSATIEQAPL